MDSITITFSPPLPCVTDHGDHLCAKPATVATIYPTGSGYLMQPICRECVAAMAKVYFPKAPPYDDDDRSGWLNMSSGEEIP